MICKTEKNNSERRVYNGKIRLIEKRKPALITRAGGCSGKTTHMCAGERGAGNCQR